MAREYSRLNLTDNPDQLVIEQVEQPVGAVRTFTGAGTYDTKFSPDSSKLYLSQGNSVFVFNTVTGASIAQYDLGQAVGAIDLSADGLTLVAAIRTAGVARFDRIDLTSGTVTQHSFTVGGNITGTFHDIAIQANGRVLLSQVNGGPLIDYDSGNGTSTYLSGPSARATFVTGASHDRILVISPNLTVRSDLVTSGSGITATYIDRPDPYAGASVPNPQIPVGALSSDGNLALLGDQLKLRNFATGTITSLNLFFMGQAYGATFSPSADRLYLLHATNQIVVIDTATLQPVAVYPVGNSQSYFDSFGDSLQLSGDGRFMSVMTSNGLQVIDLVSALPLATNGDDVISEAHTIIALGGNDTLDGIGSQWMYGGQGDDTYVVDTSGDFIEERPGEGTDTVRLAYSSYFSLANNVENVTVITAAGSYVAANGANNVLTGASGNDQMFGYSGADTLLGLGGADILDGGEGNDLVDGGEGADRLAGGNGGDTVTGGNGDDLLVSGSFSSGTSNGSDDLGTEIDTLIGGDGADAIWAGYGDSVDGGAGTDTLYLSLAGAGSGVTFNTAGLLGGTSVPGGGSIGGVESLARLRGSEFADLLTISGLSGPITVDAGGGNDLIYATTSAVYALGGLGNDRFYSGSGADTFDGGYDGGQNVIDYSQFAVGVTAEFTNFYSGTGPSGDTFTNVQTIAGSAFDDVLTGWQRDERLEGNGGADLLIGGYGQDTLLGGDGNDTLYGFDPLTNYSQAYAEFNILNGGAGDDTIYGAIRDTIDGGAGFDTLYLSLQPFGYFYQGITADFRLPSVTIAGVTIAGIEHIARIDGTNYNDTITLDNASGVLASAYGMWGDDTLVAGLWTGTLSGGEGVDLLDGRGSAHLALLEGGYGNDRIVLGALASNAVVDGGGDFDTLVITADTSIAALAGFEALEMQNSATLTISAAQLVSGLAAGATISGNGNFVITMATTDVELALNSWTVAGGSFQAFNVYGSSAGESIKGINGATNFLNGGGGDDQIRGGNQRDFIDGGDGDDKIAGAGGADILTGGAGADTFRFQSTNTTGLGAAADRITDFVIGTDRLAFQAIDPDPVTPGDQSFTFIGSAAFGATGAAQMRYMNSGADLLVQADVNGDGIADMEIILQGLAGQTLTSGNFLL